MGLLDPKMDKERTFRLLRKRGAHQAILTFQGGHDEGSVEEIKLILGTGEEVTLDTWYCGGYMYDPTTGQYKPLSEPANEDEELADLLERPINEAFGSWGGVGSTYGTLTWDATENTVTMNYVQDREQEFSHSF